MPVIVSGANGIRFNSVTGANLWGGSISPSLIEVSLGNPYPLGSMIVRWDHAISSWRFTLFINGNPATSSNVLLADTFVQDVDRLFELHVSRDPTLISNAWSNANPSYTPGIPGMNVTITPYIDGVAAPSWTTLCYGEAAPEDAIYNELRLGLWAINVGMVAGGVPYLTDVSFGGSMKIGATRHAADLWQLGAYQGASFSNPPWGPNGYINAISTDWYEEDQSIRFNNSASTFQDSSARSGFLDLPPR